MTAVWPSIFQFPVRGVPVIQDSTSWVLKGQSLPGGGGGTLIYGLYRHVPGMAGVGF